MSKLGKLWAGKLFGTNTGNLFADLDTNENQISGIIRLLDDQFGPVVYAVSGKYDSIKIELTGEATAKRDEVQTGILKAIGSLTPEGHIRGQWSSTIGTGGIFVLYPHDVSEKSETTKGVAPEHLHTTTRTLGALRLYADDVTELIAFLRRDFVQGRVIVSYQERGNEISKYSSDFEAELPKNVKLKYLKLYIQEPETPGISKIAIVELTERGDNVIKVQGAQESWVVGKAEAMVSHLRSHQKSLSTSFRKFGVNLNNILILGTLVVLPELSINRRVIFVAFVAFILWSIVQLHANFIPNVLIDFSERKPRLIERIWPQALSWIIAVTAAVMASVAYGLLKGDFP